MFQRLRKRSAIVLSLLVWRPTNFSFSHTPRQVGRGGGTGLLISNNWKYSTHSPLGNHNSFESHAITVTAPIKLQIVIIYRPPGQILATFLEELDGLLSSFMEDGTPLLVFGDFNIHLDRPYATDFHSLLASFDLKRLTTTSTHKSGNQLDLIYTQKKKKKKKKPFPLSFSPSLASLYLFEQWLRLGVTSTSSVLSDCLFKMNRFMYSPIVSRFG